ncbi:Rap1a/Tai family immunity protein [Pseudoduganella buxea]|uniref:Rap1a immunity protein domain-containing protein n=1 Tax=Pseudoduganella buxea TaxID=1949069 RepID=A0A6I3ST94_9BURK|nr:Rap1a/Tai family immunity protein [Pseudoduganella buxea]MTV52400.1 hypothetical protein [Pseudoduganella buxea]
MLLSQREHDAARRRRCRRIGLLGGLSLACAGLHAAPYVYPFNTMTGADVVARLTVDPVTDSDFRERDRAHYYVAGIKDATQGSLWCFRRALLPHELNTEVAHALKQRHSAAALKANAAPLVLDELRRRYPCDGAGAAR